MLNPTCTFIKETDTMKYESLFLRFSQGFEQYYRFLFPGRCPVGNIETESPSFDGFFINCTDDGCPPKNGSPIYTNQLYMCKYGGNDTQSHCFPRTQAPAFLLHPIFKIQKESMSTLWVICEFSAWTLISKTLDGVLYGKALFIHTMSFCVRNTTHLLWIIIY